MGPAWETVVKLAEALGVSLDAFKDAPAADPASSRPRRKSRS